MIKLRILLLRNVLYYIVLGMALTYFLITFLFIDKKSLYTNETNIDCIITNLLIKDYGIKLELKGKEKLIGYYIDKEDINKIVNNFSLGDKINITFTNIRITNNTVENTFNYKKYLYNKGIHKVVEIEKLVKIKDNTNIFYTIKNLLLKRSINLEKSYSYIYSLLFGENEYLESDYVDSYRVNGISHLFAISGSHISIFIVFLQWLLKKFKIKENKRYVIIILFLLFYMFITNFSMSIVRACVFTVLSFINTIFYFYIDSKNLLKLTLAIIIFMNPLNLFDIGLQYSFLISYGLVFMNDYIATKKGYFKKLLTISFISFIVSIPITISNFYELNLLSVFYNMFFVPYVSFLLLPLIFISYCFPILDSILYFFIEIMNKVSLFCGNINLGKLIMCKPDLSIIVIYWLSIIWGLFKLKKGKKRYFILLIILIFANSIWENQNDNYLTFFDIGQGDSMMLSVNDTYNLIDTGGVVMLSDSKYTYNLSRNKIIPYLKSIGVKKLDNLILTHGDADHMMESLYIIKNFKVDNIYLNSNSFNNLEQEVIKVAKNKNIKVHILTDNTYINISGIKLYSLNHNRNDENNSSIVLYFDINNYTVLLTGDISKEIELDLMKKYNLKNLTILKLAHHGSKTSSDYNFLKETNPKYSIISAGYDNKFKHPSTETIKNLNRLNLNYYETTKYGSITFNFNNGTFSYNYP